MPEQSFPHSCALLKQVIKYAQMDFKICPVEPGLPAVRCSGCTKKSSYKQTDDPQMYLMCDMLALNLVSDLSSWG